MMGSMGCDFNPKFGILSIPCLGFSGGHTLRAMRPRDILKTNLKRLMAESPTLDTIDRLSKASGVSKGVVERMTKAESNTGVDHLEGIAKAFGLTVSDLLSTGKPPAPKPAQDDCQGHLSPEVIAHIDQAPLDMKLKADNLLRALFGMPQITPPVNERQRKLLEKMLGPAVPDHIIERHLPPAPSSKRSRLQED